ncbi:DUF6093 family protein [Streptomyces sp. DSM 41014]|uniref:DUF6093 family protein n=1 Tax=Streptomyces hintoniae TaxID=3075521 RepID=A0ABU2UVT0_9ACTN|nr:DUF6093 family protein [Streptomyces sp. DSM 41014]MDT0477397.1 DUF6093 family protein [Streptomyces sp. DSM 41014]
MDVADVADQTAAAGRAMAEALMRDTCLIEDLGVVTTTDDGQDLTVPVVLYDGKCRVKPASTAVTTPSVNAAAQTWQYKVSIPFGDVQLRTGLRVTVTASQDPTLVGLRLTLRNFDRGTHITARRMWCTEVSR